MAEMDLVSRWTTQDGKARTEEVFGRLLGGNRLDDLNLGEHDGRIDLRGIVAPAPERLKAFEKNGSVVAEFGGLLTFERVNLTDLDLSGGHLEGFRLYNTTVSNCRFDDAQCREWRLRTVHVSDTRFVGADLRGAVLGAWHEGRGNTYQRVNFSGANLRSIACPAATFVDCDFGDALLAKVDFQSSSFIRCRFAGLLREVVFYDRGFRTGKPDPNPMQDVDFTDAELRMVEFRGLDLDQVKFPRSSDHLVVHQYRCVLERALQELRMDARWKGLTAVMEHRLKWAGPSQEVGEFNRRDLVEMGDEAEAQFAVALLQRLEGECERRN